MGFINKHTTDHSVEENSFVSLGFAPKGAINPNFAKVDPNFWWICRKIPKNRLIHPLAVPTSIDHQIWGAQNKWMLLT